ncbi:hypothetical protein H7J87_34575 [Mycolicibacterium wolinskyi]|uniref:hypothetical protein n=1 Tax=Mycolicibacterium TaxID=1866885 RepID=UPI000DA1F7FC|nr:MULTISPECIES: hypothetical protein [Mycolicibacterium]MCV7290464.1 hypothetical protein [Mycolicibacterium wolinskyi]MCV7297024.1 hypothetical protein [Mycolicibacterium goodii]
MKLRAALAMLCAGVTLAIGAAPAAAADPLDYVVHTEHVQVGPYPVTVGFTVWPLRAMQSLDFTFEPEGGIAGKSGTIATIAPDGGTDVDRLARHPRNRDVWGLDVQSLNSSGTWTLRFTIDGPQGEGTGDLTVDVLKQPGPPLPLSWAIGLIPLTLTLVFFGVVWARTGRRSDAEA